MEAVSFWQDRRPFLINTVEHCGEPMWSYGQTAITEELYRVRERDGGHVVDEVENVRLLDLTEAEPKVAYDKAGRSRAVACDFVAGLRRLPWQFLATAFRRRRCSGPGKRAYPFGWLGVMSETPPVGDIIYARHERGFALASRRNPMLSRYYIQCDLTTEIADWPDEKFWQELKRRFPADIAQRIVAGPSIGNSIAPLRSFVAEPMRYGRFFSPATPPISCRRRAPRV